MTRDEFENLADEFGECYYCGSRYANICAPHFDPNEYDYPAIFSECVSENDIDEEFVMLYEAYFYADSQFMYEDESEGILYLQKDAYGYDIDELVDLDNADKMEWTGGYYKSA